MAIDSIKLFGFAVICALAITLVRQFNREGALSVRLLSLGAVFALSAGMLAPLVLYVSELLYACGASEFASLLIKASGIAVLTYICAEFCRGSGEDGIAGGVELMGKLEILLLCISPIKQILSAAAELLD